MEALSIRESFSGKVILLTGGSGFLGKVWLTMLLDHVPDVGRIYVLLRKNGHNSAQQRFENILETSFVFKPLHDRYGDSLSGFLRERIEVIEGDASKPDLGVPPHKARELHSTLDLFVNFAGLVDFNPDLREALSINVQGALHAADFVEKCEKAALLHVSTCYVSGNREGMISEKIEVSAPNGDEFDAEKEYRSVLKMVAKIEEEQEKIGFDETTEKRIFDHSHKNNGNGKSVAREQNMTRLLKRRRLHQLMINKGTERARLFGWPNTYTYTKALAEMLIKKRSQHFRFSVFRPSIVESSWTYPFPGWNEGFNTSGPLAYLLGSWFRYLPLKVGNPFDVIPVDLVCKGLTIASAALLSGKHEEVYQCGTSHLNPFTIDRACELTSLGHRIHYRSKGKTLTERLILSRWETVPAREDHPLSTENLRAFTTRVQALVNRIPGRTSNLVGKRVRRTQDFVNRISRKLSQVEEMLKLFKPFIHDHRWIFETKALKAFLIKEKEFQFNPEKLDWRNYWLTVHMPGLRRWCFPSIEGKDRETLKTESRIRLTSPTLSTPKRVSSKGKSERPPEVFN